MSLDLKNIKTENWKTYNHECKYFKTKQEPI